MLEKVGKAGILVRGPYKYFPPIANMTTVQCAKDQYRNCLRIILPALRDLVQPTLWFWQRMPTETTVTDDTLDEAIKEAETLFKMLPVYEREEGSFKNRRTVRTCLFPVACFEVLRNLQHFQGRGPVHGLYLDIQTRAPIEYR